MAEQIKGLKNLQVKLQRLGPAAGGKALRSAAMQATLPIVQDARRRIPKNDRDFLAATYKGRKVAPGFASRNIARKSFLSKDKSFAKVRIGVKPEAYYAVQFVELGTSLQPAQPWLEPAYRSQRFAVISRFKSRLKKQILKSARGGL